MAEVRRYLPLKAKVVEDRKAESLARFLQKEKENES